jgi:PAS domain-containing protein
MAVLRPVVQPGCSFGEHVLHIRKFRYFGLCGRIPDPVRTMLLEVREQLVALNARLDGCNRQIGDSNIIGLLFWDVAGNVTEANDAFLQMVGYSRQDLLSGEVRWDSMTPSEYRAADAQSLKELRQAGTNRPYEKEYIRKDGRS